MTMALFLAVRISHVGTITIFGAVKWIGFVLLLKRREANASVERLYSFPFSHLNGRKEKENE